MGFETRVSDVRDLRAFVCVVDLRSLTAAAKVTGESKATLSRRIARLEQALGTALLRRSSRGLEATEQGVQDRQRVGPLLAQLGDANAAAAHGGRASPSGQLRVSVPPGFADALAPHFAGFCEQYPLVTLVIDSTPRFVDLDAEHVDVAFRATNRLADSSLVSLRVSEPKPEAKPLAESTAEHVDRLLSVNVRATLFTVQKALPLLVDGASVVLVASAMHSKGLPGYGVYSATKAAIRSFARTWAAELKERKIRVNSLSPGGVETSMLTGGASGEAADRILATYGSWIPLGRVGQPEEIAAAALFLASREGSYLTGSDLIVDGGFTQL